MASLRCIMTWIMLLFIDLSIAFPISPLQQGIEARYGCLFFRVLLLTYLRRRNQYKSVAIKSLTQSSQEPRIRRSRIRHQRRPSPVAGGPYHPTTSSPRFARSTGLPRKVRQRHLWLLHAMHGHRSLLYGIVITPSPTSLLLLCIDMTMRTNKSSRNPSLARSISLPYPLCAATSATIILARRRSMTVNVARLRPSSFLPPPPHPHPLFPSHLRIQTNQLPLPQHNRKHNPRVRHHSRGLHGLRHRDRAHRPDTGLATNGNFLRFPRPPSSALRRDTARD